MENLARSLSTSIELTNESVTDKKVELARHLFGGLEAQVVLADRKVQAIFGLNAFLVAALSLQSQQSLNAILNNGVTINVSIDLFLKALFLACVIVTTWSALKALSPRLRVKKSTIVSKTKSLFFFGDISSLTPDQFSDAFLSLSNEEAIKELLTSSHAVSQILVIKYSMLKRSTLSVSLALLIWVIIQINKFLG